MRTSRTMIWSAALVFVTSLTPLAMAAEPPADLCSLLPATVVSKTLNETYGSPQKTVAPRPFVNTASGTDCTYHASKGKLLFRAYVDPSPSAATELFARLKSFFGRGSTEVAGIGDEAYIDTGGGIHVRKGKVRYFLSGSANEKQIKDLATAVANQL